MSSTSRKRKVSSSSEDLEPRIMTRLRTHRLSVDPSEIRVDNSPVAKRTRRSSGTVVKTPIKGIKNKKMEEDIIQEEKIEKERKNSLDEESPSPLIITDDQQVAPKEIISDEILVDQKVLKTNSISDIEVETPIDHIDIEQIKSVENEDNFSNNTDSDTKVPIHEEIIDEQVEKSVDDKGEKTDADMEVKSTNINMDEKPQPLIEPSEEINNPRESVEDEVSKDNPELEECHPSEGKSINSENKLFENPLFIKTNQLSKIPEKEDFPFPIVVSFPAKDIILSDKRKFCKSGRFWKTNRDRFSSMITTKGLRQSFDQKRKLQEDLKRVKAMEKTMKEEAKKEREEARVRREENKKRREENAKKSEVFQTIKNPAKIKRMRKKQLRLIAKRDTLKIQN